jgi:hypothetical protein
MAMIGTKSHRTGINAGLGWPDIAYPARSIYHHQFTYLVTVTIHNEIQCVKGTCVNIVWEMILEFVVLVVRNSRVALVVIANTSQETLHYTQLRSTKNEFWR